MSRKTTSISVIIPVYNAEPYLAEAIESVLRQNRKPHELILVDDGSPDNSMNVAEQYKKDVIILRQENKGAAAARNSGLRAATGSLIAFLDADDLWTDHHLQYLEGPFYEDESADIVFGQTLQFLSPELQETPGSAIRLKNETARQGFFIGSGLYKKSVFGRAGLFDETLRLGECIDWFDRAKECGAKYRVLPDVVLRRRIHTQNQGRLIDAEQLKDYTKVLRAALARKRNR